MRRVIHLGPCHGAPVAGVASSGARAFDTPLGAVAVAPVEDPDVSIDVAAHRPEHALEVQLPFLQDALGAFEYVPLLVGDAEPERLADLLERLVRARPREGVADAAADGASSGTLIVASSDLSHGLDAAAAATADRGTLAAIESLGTDLDARQACGAAVLNGLGAFAARRGWRALAVDRRDSLGSGGMPPRAAHGATPVPAPVVGYAAVGYHAPA